MNEPSADVVVSNKTVNAFVPKAKGESDTGIPGVDFAVDRMGGTWVGGTLWITLDTIEFHANALNRAVNEGDNDWVIGWKDVTEIRDRFGLFTGIVDFVVKDGPVRTVRCYGSKSFSKALRQIIGLAPLNS